MGVDGSARVVAREDGLEADDTVVVGHLDSTEEGAVESGLAGIRNTGVDTSGIAVPHVDGDARDGLASVDINVLHFQEHLNALGELRLDGVRAEVFAGYVVWAVGDLWCQNTAGVCVEDIGDACERIIIEDACLVVVDGLPGLDIGEFTLVVTSGCRALDWRH